MARESPGEAAGRARRRHDGGTARARFAWGAVVVGCALAGSLAAVAGESSGARGLASLDPRLGPFIEAKEAQARELAKSLELKVPPDYWKAFELFRGGDWPAATNCFHRFSQAWAEQPRDTASQKGLLGALVRGLDAMSKAPYRPVMASPLRQPLAEVEMACEHFENGEPKYARAFGDDIIASIPKGSIYFGGTDPGRGLVTALVKSHVNGDPFFVLTQNQLADLNYLVYLRAMFGKKLYLPSREDSARCFQEYLADAQKRMEEGQLKPGEEVKMVTDDDGRQRVQVSPSQTAVMAINGLLAKVIFDKNPARECYLEESFPLDWMYPYLEPHGLILKLERAPMDELPAEAVRKDHDYWKEYFGRLLGDWLGDETSVRAVCETAERIYLRHDLGGFKGDPSFVRSDDAQKSYSKLRSGIGGVYAWRWQNSSSAAERKRLLPAADLAFRQALALCPYSPEAVYRYVNLLLQVNRNADALLVAETALKFSPDDPYLKDLMQKVKNLQE